MDFFMKYVHFKMNKKGLKFNKLAVTATHTTRIRNCMSTCQKCKSNNLTKICPTLDQTGKMNVL